MGGNQNLMPPLFMPDDYPFRIEVRPLLTMGGFGYGPSSLFFLISDESTKSEAGETVWHEVVHMLKRLKGPEPQDEEQVTEIAKRLYAACPEVLELCGIADKFKDDP